MPQNQTVQKRYPTIGCCGIECGLCPRYYTVGTSRCPGCAGPDFYNKHPACGFITCCVKNKGLEVCGQCPEFPCPRFKGWDASDSFVSHVRSLRNLESIKTHGLEAFLMQHDKRVQMLGKMLATCDDGRSRNVFCLAVVLLPPDELEEALKKTEASKADKDIKTRAGFLREQLFTLADKNGITLKLRSNK